MADEVIIYEYARPKEGQTSSVAGKMITTQVLDIGTQSAEFNISTDIIVIQSKGTGFWFKQGDSTVSAAAATDGNGWVVADCKADPLPVSTDYRYVDTAADA